MLLVIGEDVMRLPFTKCALLLTSFWSLEKISQDCLSQNVQCHSLAVGHRKRCDETAFHKMCNVTHKLLVIGKDVMRLPSKMIFNVAHILSVIWKRYIEPLLRNICNVTHILLAIGTCFIRSSFEPLNQHDMLLTFYVHRKRSNFTAFHRACNITHNL